MNEQMAMLKKKARILRLHIVHMIGVNTTGHLGGSCSIADIVAALYFHIMRHDPKNPTWEDRDRLILSKGHAALVQYAALAECGYFDRKEFCTLKHVGAMLQGHPDMRKTPGIEANTGSLGQGLSIAAGMAAGLRIEKRNARVFCIIGDGEMAEGQIWEAAMAASFYKLGRLTAILDQNRIQATGAVCDRFDTNPIPEKWRAFGWDVCEIDGHHMPSIVDALRDKPNPCNRPRMIVAQTVKGKGVSFAENTAAFHNGAMTVEQYESACAVLESEGCG